MPRTAATAALNSLAFEWNICSRRSRRFCFCPSWDLQSEREDWRIEGRGVGGLSGKTVKQGLVFLLQAVNRLLPEIKPLFCWIVGELEVTGVGGYTATCGNFTLEIKKLLFKLVDAIKERLVLRMRSGKRFEVIEQLEQGGLTGLLCLVASDEVFEETDFALEKVCLGVLFSFCILLAGTNPFAQDLCSLVGWTERDELSREVGVVGLEFAEMLGESLEFCCEDVVFVRVIGWLGSWYGICKKLTLCWICFCDVFYSPTLREVMTAK